METIGVMGYCLAALGFTVVALLLRKDQRQERPARILSLCIFISAIWSACHAWQIHQQLPLVYFMPLEVVKTTSWGVLLLATILGTTRLTNLWQRHRHFFWFVPLSFGTLFIDLLHLTSLLASPFYLFAGHLAIAIGNLILIEYLYRQGSARFRWSFKPLAIALACMSVFDFVIYAQALLFHQLDFSLWYTRGYISLLTLPLVLISVRRNELWGCKVFVSRQVVFHSTLLFGAGIYLLLMAGAGYYIRYLGGNWSNIGQILFLTLALVLLVVLFLSESIRRQVKVFISKHFFSNRYDYRQKWLALNQTLESSSDNKDYYVTALAAMCQLIQSSCGLLYKLNKNDQFELLSRYQHHDNGSDWQSTLAQLPTHQALHHWIIDIDEYDQYPEVYKDLSIELGPVLQQPLKIFVPLIHSDQLYGYFLLSRPSHGELLNYEDRDLLRTVGQQLANFLVLNETSLALMETSQFDAFNRMSAFMVHDLKNVIGQLTLLLANAKQHKHNPAFIDDAFDTLHNAVDKMNNMLGQLRQKQSSSGPSEQVSLKSLLQDACQQRTIQRPFPRLGQTEELSLYVEKEKLLNIIKHLIQNAQDASPPNGDIQLNLINNTQELLLQIIDQGCGMEEDFVRHRLFKPFDTTKGNAGMGIGAYESKLFIESIGGRVEVMSTPGQGTTFNLYFPKEMTTSPAALLDTI